MITQYWDSGAVITHHHPILGQWQFTVTITRYWDSGTVITVTIIQYWVSGTLLPRSPSTGTTALHWHDNPLLGQWHSDYCHDHPVLGQWHIPDTINRYWDSSTVITVTIAQQIIGHESWYQLRWYIQKLLCLDGLKQIYGIRTSLSCSHVDMKYFRLKLFKVRNPTF